MVIIDNDVKPKKSKSVIPKDILESFTSNPLSFSSADYVSIKWTSFFGTNIGEQDKQILTSYIDQFRQTDQCLHSAFDFIKHNPKLLEYQKVQIGEGEFALFLLFPDAVRVNKGDLKFFGNQYEVKRIKDINDPIRFGTNINIRSINNFRYVTFALKKFFNYCEYSSHDDVKLIKSEYDKIIGDSDASVSKVKLKELYTFFYKSLKFYGMYNSREFTKLSYEVYPVVWSFLEEYPLESIFEQRVTDELLGVYKTAQTDILVIDHNNDFRINPTMEFHSLNQYVRPQMILVDNPPIAV